jgi:transcriptional regulator with XRE-family HTH domain
MPALSQRHEALGNAIRTVRKEKGWTQEHAALACGLDRSYFGAIERGERNVAIANVWKISDGLGVQASELLARGEDANKPFRQ